MLDLEESMTKMKVIHVAGTKGKVSLSTDSFIYFKLPFLKFLNPLHSSKLHVYES